MRPLRWMCSVYLVRSFPVRGPAEDRRLHPRHDTRGFSTSLSQVKKHSAFSFFCSFFSKYSTPPPRGSARSLGSFFGSPFKAPSSYSSILLLAFPPKKKAGRAGRAKEGTKDVLRLFGLCSSVQRRQPFACLSLPPPPPSPHVSLLCIVVGGRAGERAGGRVGVQVHASRIRRFQSADERRRVTRPCLGAGVFACFGRKREGRGRWMWCSRRWLERSPSSSRALNVSRSREREMGGGRWIDHQHRQENLSFSPPLCPRVSIALLLYYSCLLVFSRN